MILLDVVETAAELTITQAFKSGPVVGIFIMCFIIIALLIGVILYKEIRKMKQDFKNNSELVKQEIWAEVEVLRGEQKVLGNQIKEVKDNVHQIKNNMQAFTHRIDSMDRTLNSMHTTLKFISIQMGGSLNKAIEESIKNQEEHL